jgi:outer membrane lipoprotein-sorting protein
VVTKLLLLVGLLLAGTASAKTLTETDLREFQKKMKTGNSLSVDFVQKHRSALRDRVAVREGHAEFSAPSRFRWILKKPEEEKIFDGKHFYDYDPSSKSASRYQPNGPKAYALRQVVDLVLNFDSLLKRYELVSAAQDGDSVKVELKPKEASDVASVELHLSEKSLSITFLKLNLKGGDYLAHDFTNPDRKPLGDERFALPAGVKVTDSY